MCAGCGEVWKRRGSTIQRACGSGRQHKAQGGAQRNPGLRRWMIPARGAGGRVRSNLCRPFYGLRLILPHYTQGSATLHPGLYAAARYRGLIEGFSLRLRAVKLWAKPCQKTRRLMVCYTVNTENAQRLVQSRKLAVQSDPRISHQRLHCGFLCRPFVNPSVIRPCTTLSPGCSLRLPLHSDRFTVTL